MRPFLSLLKLYFATTYDIGTFLAWFKQGPKGVAKGIGVIILAVYMVAAFGFFILLTSVQTYLALKPFGLEAVVLQNGIVSATVVVWVFGLVTCLTTYFMTGAEAFLLSLPLKPRALFGAKFSLVYASEAALAFLLIGVNAGVYAFFERPGPLYYVYALLIALASPLLPIAAFYFLLVPLMKASRLLRRKDAVMILGGFIGVALAMGWQILNQRVMMKLNDAEWILANLADPGSAVARLADAFPPARWAARALALAAGAQTAPGRGGSAANFLSYVAVQAAAAAFAIIALAGPYARSLTGFEETYVQRLKDSGAYIGTGFKLRGQFLANLAREFKAMLREPAYLLNGPFVVILMPGIFTVMYLSMRDELLKDLPFLTEEASRSARAIGAMGFSAFLGSMTSITATSISREGKLFPFLKSMPLAPFPYLGAKLVHGLFYGLFAAVAGPALVSLIAPLGLATGILAGFAGFGISTLISTLGLALDTKNPRLDWPNPTVALKQNPSATIAALGGMALVGGVSALGAFLKDWPPILPLIGLAGLGLAAGAFALYYPWAKRRLVVIE